MPVGDFVPSEFEFDYPRWTAPGIAYNGYVWAWNNTSGKYEPTALAFDPAGTAAAAVAAHVGLSNPHTQYLLESAFVPPGSDTRVLFNDGGAWGTDAGLTYAKATDRLTVAGGLVAPSMRPASDGGGALQFLSAAGITLASVNTTTNRWTFDRNEVQYDVGIVNVTMRPTLTTGYSTGFSTQLYYGTSMSYGGTTDSANTSYYAQVITANAANVTWASAWKSYIDVRNTSVLSNVASILIPDVNSVAAGATLTNVYGIYVAAQTKGTNKYALYTNAGLVRFGDRVILSASTTSRASMTMPAGTAPSGAGGPNAGDIWYATGDRLKFYRAATETIASGVPGTGGSATATGTWGATEQSMLQKCYDIVRAFGMLS